MLAEYPNLLPAKKNHDLATEDGCKLVGLRALLQNVVTIPETPNFLRMNREV
jgi:hypothetical protein